MPSMLSAYRLVTLFEGSCCGGLMTNRVGVTKTVRIITTCAKQASLVCRRNAALPSVNESISQTLTSYYSVWISDTLFLIDGLQDTIFEGGYRSVCLQCFPQRNHLPWLKDSMRDETLDECPGCEGYAIHIRDAVQMPVGIWVEDLQPRPMETNGLLRFGILPR